MKNILGIALGILIICLEYQFACWLQGTINALIPHTEYYGIIHLATLIAHFLFFGSLYVYIFFVGIAFLGFGFLSRK